MRSGLCSWQRCRLKTLLVATADVLLPPQHAADVLLPPKHAPCAASWRAALLESAAALAAVLPHSGGANSLLPGGAEAKRRTARNAVWEIRAAAGSQTLFDCDWSCADSIAALQRAAAAFLPANLAAQLAPLLARQLPPAVPGPAPAPEAAVRQALGAPVPLESARGAAAAAGGPAAGATQVEGLGKQRIEIILGPWRAEGVLLLLVRLRALPSSLTADAPSQAALQLRLPALPARPASKPG